MTKTAFCLIVSITLVAAPYRDLMAAPRVRAQPAASNREVTTRLEKGYQLRLSGKNEEALELFKEALVIEPTGKVLAMLAGVEHELKRWVDAEAHATAALKSTDRYVAKNRKYIEATLAETSKHIGLLEITGAATADALVTADGVEIGKLPDAFRLGEGSVGLLVSKPGFLSWKGTGVIRGDETTRVEADMVPERPVPTVAEVAPLPTMLKAPTSDGGMDSSRGRRTAGWAMAATGMAVAVFGGALWNADGAALGEGKQADTQGGPLLLGVGVVTAAAGVYLLKGAF